LTYFLRMIPSSVPGRVQERKLVERLAEDLPHEREVGEVDPVA